MSDNQTSASDEVYTVSTLESSISRTLMLIVALGALSYFPMVVSIRVAFVRLLFYALSLLALAQVVALAAVEKTLRLPRSTLTMPAAAFFLLLAYSKLSSWPPFGRMGDGGGSFGESIALALMAYLGYIFLDSRRERRRLLVLISLSLAAIFVLDGIRMAVAALGVGGAGRPSPMVGSAAEAGLYLSFSVPLIAAQVIARRSWMSRYAFLPALIGGIFYALMAAPTLALFAVLVGLALISLMLRRASALISVPLLIAVILSAAILAGAHAPLGGGPGAPTKIAPKARASISAKPADRTNRSGEYSVGDQKDMGTASILFFLAFIAAFLIQSAPGVDRMTEAERAFHLGVVGGLGGYAVVSTIYGSSILASPTVWLMLGAAARLMNPVEEPVAKLSFRGKFKREKAGPESEM